MLNGPMIDIVLSILIGSMAAIMAVVGGVLATEKRYIKKCSSLWESPA
jgi:hypothetical protein